MDTPSDKPIENAIEDQTFRVLLDTAPDAIIVVNDAGRMVLVNAQTEELFGYRRSELLGQSIERLIPARFHGQHVKHRMGFARRPTTRAMGSGLELFALHRDGTEFSVEISLSPCPTAAGDLVSCAIRDVTERKRMEKEIVQARQLAERANKANSAWLAAASHDLRQPVQALALLNGALRRTVKDARAQEMVANQQHSIDAMTNLLNSLLDISKLDAGGVEPSWEEFPLQRILDRLTPEFSRQAQQKGLEFRTGKCEAIVRSDANLLAEILQNLVSNAIRYTPTGSVEISCEPAEGQCRISVKDTGIGIEPGDISNIFREFHQGAARGRKREGFGLGLAIVQRIAGLLSHPIEVKSEPGKGSEFTLTVPTVLPGSAAAEADSDAASAAAAANAGLILLVEDDPVVAEAWLFLLTGEGYDVEHAVSLQEVTALLDNLPEAPALLISDFHLAGEGTGTEVIAAVRAYFGQTIPAFIITGDTSKVVQSAPLLGNCELLNKPVAPDQLLMAARDAVRTGTVATD